MTSANHLFGRVNMASGRFVTPLNLQVVNVADLPVIDDSNDRSILIVADGAGGQPVLAVAEGSNWVRPDTGEPVSVMGSQPGAAAGLGMTVPVVPGLTIGSDAGRQVRHTRFAFTDTVITTFAEGQYASLAFADLPATNLQVLTVQIDLSVVKGNQPGGFLNAQNINTAIGTEGTMNSSLIGPEVNVVAAFNNAETTQTVSIQHPVAGSPTDVLFLLNTGANRKLHLNFGTSGVMTVNDTLTLTGHIDLFYIDVGNLGS